MKVTLFQPKQLHFIHIGKTAGTALKHALSDFTQNKSTQIHLHEHNFKLTDVPNDQLCFFSVRDPLDRFVSGFYSRQRQGKPKYNSKWNAAEEIAFSLFETPNKLANDLYSSNSQKRVNAEYAMLSLKHVNSSYWDWFVDEKYLLSRKKSIAFIFNQTNLNSDFEIFKNSFSISESAVLPDKNSIDAHSNSYSFDTYLDELSKANLRKWYAKEYYFLKLLETHFNTKR
ncbi:MAG: hypothetical protein ACI93N_001492 [Flavobacteriaceae bacterium]|jgi:hypothetical protein